MEYKPCKSITFTLVHGLLTAKMIYVIGLTGLSLRLPHVMVRCCIVPGILWQKFNHHTQQPTTAFAGPRHPQMSWIFIIIRNTALAGITLIIDRLSTTTSCIQLACPLSWLALDPGILWLELLSLVQQGGLRPSLCANVCCKGNRYKGLCMVAGKVKPSWHILKLLAHVQPNRTASLAVLWRPAFLWLLNIGILTTHLLYL